MGEFKDYIGRTNSYWSAGDVHVTQTIEDMTEFHGRFKIRVRSEYVGTDWSENRSVWWTIVSPLQDGGAVYFHFTGVDRYHEVVKPERYGTVGTNEWAARLAMCDGPTDV